MARASGKGPQATKRRRLKGGGASFKALGTERNARAGTSNKNELEMESEVKHFNLSANCAAQNEFGEKTVATTSNG